MKERLPCTLPVGSSSADITKRRPKKVQNGIDATESVDWTDDEVELLLGVVRSYSSQKD